jgi:hypothetical protein
MKLNLVYNISMVIRYTVQYWYFDEHDTLNYNFDTLKQAREFVSTIDRTKYKDIDIYARHWNKVNEPFEHNNVVYDGWKWILMDDDFIQYYNVCQVTRTQHINEINALRSQNKLK